MLHLLLILLAVCFISAFLVVGLRYAVLTEGFTGKVILVLVPLLSAGGVSGLMGMTIYGI